MSYFHFLAQLINMMANLLTILVFVWAILSWFLPPYNPVREALDRIVEPMLAPIRRVVPTLGMIDISPIIFMILVQFLAQVLIGLLPAY